MPFIMYGQTNWNLGLIGDYEWPTTEGSDIWGWVDGTGNEYALVGLNNGFSCVVTVQVISAFSRSCKVPG